MTLEHVLLWVICAGVTVVPLCLIIGAWLANVIYGRTPGGRGK